MARSAGWWAQLQSTTQQVMHICVWNVSIRQQVLWPVQCLYGCLLHCTVLEEQH